MQVNTAFAHPPTPVHPAPSSSAGVDSLICQWVGCGDRATSAEALYEHVCDKHVGRKSTNNLNLQCSWGNCRTTTVKRDHITSHIRVHVPLKPHKCDFCQKSFKRPQDLKKHVKTHADDSVLLDSPEAATGIRSSISSSNYQTSLPKSGYYGGDHASQNHSNNYSNHGSANNYSFAGGMPNQTSNYGPVYYGTTQMQGAGDYGLTESRKRGHDALNEFFGDAKRRLIDATAYQDLGARFGGLANLGLPISNDYSAPSYNGRTNDYGSTATAYPVTIPAAPFNYALPFSELKTKNDLMNIDQFLEQLQNTVYEHPDHAAAAGFAQPGIHQQSTGVLAERHSLSPETQYVGSSLSVSGLAPSTLDDATPALTPGSHMSTHSPMSAHSNPIAASPATRHAAPMYPTLPSLNEMQQFSYSSGAAPPATLGGHAYYDDDRRRYSGILQRAAPPPRSTGPAHAVDSHSRRSSTDASLSKSVRAVEISSPETAPTAAAATATASVARPRRGTGSSVASSSEASSSSADVRSEAWVQNIRIIEALREYLKVRLQRAEYDDAGSPNGAAHASQQHHQQHQQSQHQRADSQMREAQARAGEQEHRDTEMGGRTPEPAGGNLYPILRAVEAAS